MPSPARLTAPDQFRLVYREGARVADELMTVHIRHARRAPSRVGIAVRRQLGGAVQRNRLKRRLREASGRALKILPPGAEVVIVPHARAGKARFQELVASLTELFTRARTGARS